MSDQYASQTPPVHRPGMEPNRNMRTDPPVPPVQQVQVTSGSGLGTGLMVAGVFVVVGLLAFAFYAPGDATPPPAVNAPAEAVIESDGTTVPTTPETTAPIAPATDPAAAPMAPAESTIAPDPVAPATPAPDAAAPDATAPAAPAQPAPAP